MGWKLSDFPDPRARVEQATAAPGENRDLDLWNLTEFIRKIVREELAKLDG